MVVGQGKSAFRAAAGLSCACLASTPEVGRREGARAWFPSPQPGGRQRWRPGPATKPENAERAFLAKWLRIWVGLLTVVTLVVVAYLTFITNSLADVNGNLGVVVPARWAERAPTPSSCPSHVDRINDSLSKIDTALKPIPGQAGVRSSAPSRRSTTSSSRPTPR